MVAVRFSAATAILYAALVTPAVAQVRDARQVLWSFHFYQTLPPSLETLAPSLDAPRRYPTYGARESLELGLSVRSYTSTPTSISQARLRATLSFQMFIGGSEIPTVITWEPTIKHGEAPTVPSDLISDVPLPPKGQLIFSLVVRRADGLPFAAAEYTVVLRMPGLPSAISTTDGAPWPGRVPSLTGSVTLAIIERSTLSEISTMHFLAGLDLYSRRQLPADAAGRLELAVQTDPSNTRARRLLGNTYMTLGFYRLAIITYENLVTLPLERHRENLRALAVAYLADRDEAGATRILQELRLSSAEIASTLNEMRETVTELDDARWQK